MFVFETFTGHLLTLAQKGLPLPVTKKILKDALTGLAQLHDQDIVHTGISTAISLEYWITTYSCRYKTRQRLHQLAGSQWQDNRRQSSTRKSGRCSSYPPRMRYGWETSRQLDVEESRSPRKRTCQQTFRCVLICSCCKSHIRNFLSAAGNWSSSASVPFISASFLQFGKMS